MSFWDIQKQITATLQDGDILACKKSDKIVKVQMI